jgi:hypothetical protein
MSCFRSSRFPIAGDPRGMIATLVGSEAGAKVRTGGVTADLYPTPHDLARFIAACAQSRCPVQGHRRAAPPLRHRSDAVGAEEFGFLNVFIAGCIAHDHELDEPTLVELLTESRIDAFTFEDDRIIWRDHIIDGEAFRTRAKASSSPSAHARSTSRARICGSLISCDAIGWHPTRTHYNPTRQ